MQKDYRDWHAEKTQIENNTLNRVFFHEREVWWCSTGSNIGFEQDGKGKKFSRPVLIFKKFNKEICWILPLSTRIKTGKFYSPVTLSDTVPRVAILSQLRLIDAKRLMGKIGIIDSENYNYIQKAVINLCGS